MRTTKQLKSISRDKIAGNYSTLIMALLLYTLIPSLLTSLFSSVMHLDSTRSYIIYYLVNVLIMLLANVIGVGFIRMTMDLFRLKRAYGNTLFFAFREHADRYIGAGFVSLLLSEVPLIPFYLLEQNLINEYMFQSEPMFSDSVKMVLIILMVIGILLSLFLSLMYALVYPVMIDNPQMGILASFRQSRQMMKGRKGKLFYLYLSFLPLLLLSLLSLGIGLLWVYPLIQTTVTAFYMDIIGELDHVSYSV